MNIHILWLTVLICIQTSFAIKAQDTTLTWFDKSWKETTEENSHYFRKAWKENNLLVVQDFYASGNLQMTGAYSSMEPKVKEGIFVCYNEDGLKTSEGRYVRNVETGPWSRWYDDGSTDQTGAYMTDEEFPIDQRTAAGKQTGIIFSDPLSLKTGEWEYYHHNGKISARITYTKGEITDAAYWNEDGTEADDDFLEDLMPSFPGGDSALFKFLGENIKYPDDALFKNISGTVYVQFTIDRNGDLKDAKIARSVYPSIDQEALRVINQLPKWTPGIQANRRINVTFNLPIKFSIGKRSKRSKKKKK